MINRTWFRRFIRLGIVMVFLAWPMLKIDLVFPMQAVILGAVLAYGGTDDVLVAYWALLAFGIELLYAMDIGSISLSFTLTAGMLILVGRWVNFRFWNREQGWSLISFLRSSLLAIISVTAISVLSVVIGVVLHGHEKFYSRLLLEVGSLNIFALEFLATAVILLLFRWADEPLHRRITFGI